MVIKTIYYMEIDGWHDLPVIYFSTVDHLGFPSMLVSVWEDGRIAWLDNTKAPLLHKKGQPMFFVYRGKVNKSHVDNALKAILNSKKPMFFSTHLQVAEREIPFLSERQYRWFTTTDENLIFEVWSTLLVNRYRSKRKEILEFMRQGDIESALGAFGKILNNNMQFFTSIYDENAKSMRSSGASDEAVLFSCFEQFVLEAECFLNTVETIESLIPDDKNLVSEVVMIEFASKFCWCCACPELSLSTGCPTMSLSSECPRGENEGRNGKTGDELKNDSEQKTNDKRRLRAHSAQACDL